MVVPIGETSPDHAHIFSRDITPQTQTKKVDKIKEVLVKFVETELEAPDSSSQITGHVSSDAGHVLSSAGTHSEVTIVL